MEPRAGAAQALSGERDPRFALRLGAACVLLVGLTMAQSPGEITNDTKLDLALAPWEFLTRALHLWDAEIAFGQLQNQAYGYWWPMGPFFLLGGLAELPAWVVQRLWMALVLAVALVGAARLARALGVRSDLACLVVGFGYALSPRMLTTVGPISIEAWPSALAPWVLLPLVVGSERGSPIRAAAVAGFAVAMVGGVNAAATFAVLPLGVLWLLTRRPGPRRRAMMLWWPVFTAMGTLWWLVPLFVLGSYSPPFLDYIEAAPNTTLVTTLFDALRGTSHWVPYVDTTWRAGNDLIREIYLPVNSGVLLLLGVAGILRAGPHRLFLASGLLLGLLAVTFGHVGEVQGWFAPTAQGVLDGLLAPLRNVHKFDPLVRLPLVLGLGLLVDRLVDELRTTAPGGRRHALSSDHHALAILSRTVIIATAAMAVVGSSIPALTGRLTPSGTFERVPGYWEDAVAWLERESGEGTALLVPGSSFGSYVWGFPRDEPIQSLADASWAVRNAVPLAPPGNIRMLDAITATLAQGEPSPGLAPYLRRAGVSHLVVRNDLARDPDVPDPILVHQALEGSEGIVRGETFGPDVGGEAHLSGEEGRILINSGWQNDYPAVEIYEVAGTSTGPVETENPPVVVGGPEDLLDLAALGLLDEQPTVLAADLDEETAPPGPIFLTDGLRRTERHFGRVHDGTSATLTRDDPLRFDKPTRDYASGWGRRWFTTAAWRGVRRIVASSSMADASALGTVQPGQLPYAAMDGRRATAWTANQRPGEAWWQVVFLGGRAVDEVTIRTAGSREVVRVRTENGVSEAVGIGPRTTRVVPVDDARTGWLRIEDASGRSGHRMSLAEVDVFGVRAERDLVLPVLPSAWDSPRAVVLRRLVDARAGCAEVDGAVRCVPGRQVRSEEWRDFRRVVSMPEASRYDISVTARARVSRPMRALLVQDLPAAVSASTIGNPDLRASGLAAVDGDPGTAWTARLDDLVPTLRLNWIGERRVRALELDVAPDTAARLPTLVKVSWPGGQQVASVDSRGRVELEPVVTDQLTVEVQEAEQARSLAFDSAQYPVPIGIGELRVVGVPYYPLVLPDEPRSFPCRVGPTLRTPQGIVRTSVRASPRELYAGAEVRATVCGDESVELAAGRALIEARSSRWFSPESVVLRAAGPEVAPASDDVQRLFATRHNFNPGWRAWQGDEVLPAVPVDGWRQGWWEGEGSGQLRTAFVPDVVHRSGLAAGLVSFVALLAIVLVPRRRWRDTTSPALAVLHLHPVALALLASVGGGLLAGWVGSAVAAVGFVAAAALRRSGLPGAEWVVAGTVLPGAAAYAFRPWGDPDGWAGSLAWPQYSVVLLVGALLGWLAGAWLRGRWPRRRMKGRSTAT